MRAKFELTEKDYRYLFENASDAMWVHDMEGNILDGNRAFETLTGYTLQEWADMNMKQFLTEEFLDLARGVKRKLLNGDAIQQPYEQQLIKKGGTIRIMKMATSPVIINGKIRGFQHVARDITEEKQLEENMRYYVQLITRAQEEERKRISRELHDEVASSLLLLTQHLDAIASGTKPKLPTSLKERVEDLRNLTIEALGSLRRCAQDLRPRILDDLGLVAALEWMAEELVKNHRIDARVKVDGAEQTLPVEVQLLLFRIAQEALSNIRKHAGASIAVVKLEFGDDSINMAISDNGRGFELLPRVEDLASAGKLGIIGMYERARLLGGSFEIKSKLGKGTQVIVRIPL